MAPTPELDFSSCTPIVSLKNQLISKWNLIFSKSNKIAWISFSPQIGFHVYPCYACRDMFVSKCTFQDHVNRRAILIKYKCRECHQTLNFYNRCSFLLHTRSHFSLAEGKIDLNNVEIYNLPFGMMGFLPDPRIQILYDEDEDTIDEDTYINAQFYFTDLCERGKQIITLRPNDLLFNRTGEHSGQLALKQISRNIPRCQFITVACQKNLKRNICIRNCMKVKKEAPDGINDTQLDSTPQPTEHSIQMPIISKIESLNNDATYPECPECKISFKYSMKYHFSGKNSPTLECSACKYIAPSKCSYSAHQRIHSRLPPFICPECGKKFETRQYLMKHLDDVCFHLAKQVRIRCPGKRCSKVFASAETFSAHFANHLQKWYQCNLCKKCFQNDTEFSEHAQSHSGSCYREKVVKCLSCKFDDSIIYKDNIKQHLDYHSKDRSKYIYVFVCKFCRSFLRSKANYAAHLLKCPKIPTITNQVNSYTIDLCSRCHSRIIYYDDENTIPCSKCKFYNSLHPRQKEKPKEKTNNQFNKPNVFQAKVKTCLLCKKDYSTTLKDHISGCKYGYPQVELKKLEYETSCQRDPVIHYENNGSHEQMPIRVEKDTSEESDIKDTSTESEINYICKEETYTDSSTKSPTKTLTLEASVASKRKRKRAPFVFRTKKINLSSPPEKIIDLQAEEAKPFDGTYYCKMCDFQESDRDKFHLHVMNHRYISTDYQCMECGECFVVKPTLIKHLKHFHKIEDTDSYLESNNCYDKNAVEELKEIMELSPGESREPIEKNQCRVCLQLFSDDQELKRHFRVHGMAFLMRNSRDAV
ncbi:zinc finger protein 532-like [Harmonia axyridis]|uniref:zinc finger protein 532-like n=1 Tax=Harmonia axyridis TaxID=115357 RepID=UPI001E276CEF|nr:zinc finger protein 532-like [Harmonia axyridis]